MNRPRGISADLQGPTRRAPLKSRSVPIPAGLPSRALRGTARFHAPDKIAVTSSRFTWNKVWEFAQYPLFAIFALAASANTTFGQSLVAAYAVVVIFLRRRPSALSFGIALLLLISIPIFTLISQPTIAENIAIYVYELLVVGTIQAILELKQTT